MSFVTVACDVIQSRVFITDSTVANCTSASFAEFVAFVACCLASFAFVVAIPAWRIASFAFVVATPA